jgi:limiting CO2-inducible B/C-like protein
VGFAERAVEIFPEAVERETFVARSAAALAVHGFVPGSALAMIGVCRDELTFPLVDRLQRVWGPSFDLSSLAGMLFLGRTGIAAAKNHAPSADGRQRFVAFVFSHIGIDEDGVVGQCRRPGQAEPSPACGALAAFRQELVEGRLDVDLDPADLEQSLLKQRLLRAITYGDVPDLVSLTRLARDVIYDDLLELVSQLEHGADTDVAVISGVQVHGPAGSGFVAPGRAFAHVGRDRAEHDLVLGAATARPR